MKKLLVSALLFPILLAVTVPVGSQTRPRRVNQPANANSANSETTNNQERERERQFRSRTPDFREGRRESRWPGILLNTGLSIGTSIGSRTGRADSCSPSRGSILNGPRFNLLGSNR